MSTSSSLVAGRPDEVEVRSFLYPEAEISGDNGAEIYGPIIPGGPSGEENIKRREQAAHDAGVREGETAARSALEAELTQTRAAVTEAIAGFWQERQKFYEGIEPTIVNLALGIARKILHREAQVDPMLLAGMVRVALEKIEFSSQVSLRIHPASATEWREYFQRHLDSRDLPELVEDPAVDANRCVLETHLGKTDLGWEVQFKEIEQGLLDLLAQRPQAAS